MPAPDHTRGVTSLPDAWAVTPEVPARASPFETTSDDARSPERALVERALAKDEVALATLYAQHAPAIQRFLRDLLGDAHAAADATQETFARAFRRLDTLHDTGRVAPWLFGIARNVSLEIRKANRRRGRVLVPDTGEHEAARDVDSWRSPEDEMIGREALVIVRGALDELSEDRRTVLLLRLDHGLAYEEIARLMKWSLAKVKVEIFRGRQALRERLEKYEGGAR